MTPDARLFMRYLKWRSTVQRLLLDESAISVKPPKAVADWFAPASD